MIPDINLCSIPQIEKTSLVRMPNGDYYRHSDLNLMKIDQNNNLYRRINLKRLEDSVLYANLVISCNKKHYIRADLADKYIDDSNVLIDLGNSTKIKNIAEYDLAVALENSDDCVSVLQRTKTDWSEDWCSLPDGFQLRSHKFSNEKEYKEFCRLLSLTNLIDGTEVYFQRYRGYGSVGKNIVYTMSVGFNVIAVRTNHQLQEIFQKNKKVNPFFEYDVYNLEVTDERLLVSRDIHVNVSIPIRNGHYKMYHFWSIDPALGSEIFLVLD